MKLFSLLAGLSLAATVAQAQEAPAPTGTATATPSGTTPAQTAPASAMPANLKLGYTNVQYVLAASPQTKVIKSQLESAGRQYEKAIQDKMKDLEDKFAAYQKNEGTMMESIKQDKQNELRQLESSIRNLQENAQTELKSKEQELVKPELDKIYAAINDVAKINGYSYVLNSEQVILYAAEGGDITPLVLKKLGYPEPKDEPEAKASTSTGSGSSATSGSGSGAPKPTGTRPGPPSPTKKKGK